MCRDRGIETLVCSTNEETWKRKNVKHKTDSDDALRQFTPVHVPNGEVREHRTLVIYRKARDERMNQIKTSMRSLFANRGLEIARRQRAWYTGRELIDSYREWLATEWHWLCQCFGRPDFADGAPAEPVPPGRPLSFA